MTERTKLQKVSAGRYWVLDRATDFTMGGVFRRDDGTWAIVLSTTGYCHEGLPTMAAGQRLIEQMVHVRKLPKSAAVDTPPNDDWLKSLPGTLAEKVEGLAEGIRSRLIDEHYDDELYDLARMNGVEVEALDDATWDTLSDAVWDALVRNMGGRS